MTDLIVDQPALSLRIETEDQTVLLNQTQPAVMTFEIVGVQGPPGEGVTDGDKGDIVVSGSGGVMTIDNDAVTNAKLANMAEGRIKGRVSAGAGDPEDLTGAQVASVLPLATETTPGLARRVEIGPTRYYAFDDFMNIVANGQAIGDLVVTNSGTGAGQTAVAHGYTVGAGWVAFNTGTTATGRTARALSTAALFLGAGPAVYRAVGLTGPLSTSVERYTTRVGFIDSVSGESTDGVFFRYSDNVNSGRWQAVHRRAGVETAADTGITYAAATVYRFEIETDEINKQSVFKIDGVTVATITTNFPDNGLTGAGVLVLKGLGTTSVAAITMDYQSVEQILTGRL